MGRIVVQRRKRKLPRVRKSFPAGLEMHHQPVAGFMSLCVPDSPTTQRRDMRGVGVDMAWSSRATPDCEAAAKKDHTDLLTRCAF